MHLEESGITDCVVVEGRVNASMSFNLFTGTDKCSHPPTANKGLLERLKPERVTASVLMVRFTEDVERVDDLLVCLSVIIVDQEY